MKHAPDRLPALLEDGFTKRMACEYLAIQETERNSGLFDKDYLSWAHEHGFLAESAYAYGLTEQNLGLYLSDYDYWKLWPLNDWQRIWINDKLTLNAALCDSDLQRYLPEYYYYTARNRLIPLQYSNGEPTTEAFLEKLREKGMFACKPCNGTEANGFHVMEYATGSYLFDGKEKNEQQMLQTIQQLTNFVFTEFITPSKDLAAINSRIHTIRLLVVNESGSEPVPYAGYIRFAAGSDDEAFLPNYQAPTRADIFSYNTDIDLITGQFGNGKIVYASKVIDSPTHPTSGMTAKGSIDCWQETLDVVRRISLKFGACEYLGFDIGITDDGPRVMEINSHSGIKYLQLYRPLLASEQTAAFFRAKLAAIDSLTPAEKEVRNGIAR